MRFCMITTFFGPHSFGGDSVYIERLSEALLKKGHSVDVVYCQDAFEATRGRVPLREYDPPHGLRIHKLKSYGGTLSLLWTHQFGSPGLHSGRIRRILRRGSFDVVHFHNISLVGGPSLLTVPVQKQTLKIMSTHDHWLVCPLSLLWKFNRDTCKKKQCVACSLYSRRPPQWWRYTAKISRSIRHLDLLIFPSNHSMQNHRRWGIANVRMAQLPYFIPDDWLSTLNDADRLDDTTPRPYFLAVGRLMNYKGFQDVIPHMKDFPEMDLVIAGDGPYREKLMQYANGLSNVHFTGLLGFKKLISHYAGARAVIVPSNLYETFGYVVAEAFALGTPVIVRNRGSLSELVAQSEGGLIYDTPDELVAAMKAIACDDTLRNRLAKKGREAIDDRWSEKQHINLYIELILDLMKKREGSESGEGI